MIKRFLIKTAFVFSVSGCAVVHDEFSSIGGYAAVQADRFLKAVTFQEHVDRYRTLSYFLTSMALHTVFDADGALETMRHTNRLFAELEAMDTAIKHCAYPVKASVQPVKLSAADEINAEVQPNIVEAPVQPICTLSGGGTGTAFDFEHQSLAVQRAIEKVAWDLANNVGLRLDLKNIGSLTNIASLGNYVFSLGDQFGALREAGASYRAMTHIYARSVASNCSDRETVIGKPCNVLKTALSDLYVDGVYLPQPTLNPNVDKDQRRLQRIFNKTNAAVAGATFPPGGYWTGGLKEAAKHIVVKGCSRAMRFVESGDKKDFKGKEICKSG